ncbi:MAG: hypothetical protein M1423_09375 [Acidobacteria bacterium]|nr:hypothetical protein [Acidobacteriota bacterium]
MNAKADFLLGAEIRYGNGQGQVVYRRVSRGVALHVHKFQTPEPYYQYSVVDSLSNTIKPENRLTVATTIGVPWKRWRVSNRDPDGRRFMVGGGIGRIGDAEAAGCYCVGRDLLQFIGGRLVAKPPCPRHRARPQQ